MSDQPDLGSLHDVLATYFLEALKGRGDNAPAASLVKEAREFLKDNGVTDRASRPGSKLNPIARSLPHDDPDLPQRPRAI